MSQPMRHRFRAIRVSNKINNKYTLQSCALAAPSVARAWIVCGKRLLNRFRRRLTAILPSSHCHDSAALQYCETDNHSSSAGDLTKIGLNVPENGLGAIRGYTAEMV